VKGRLLGCQRAEPFQRRERAPLEAWCGARQTLPAGAAADMVATFWLVANRNRAARSSLAFLNRNLRPTKPKNVKMSAMTPMVTRKAIPVEGIWTAGAAFQRDELQQQMTSLITMTPYITQPARQSQPKRIQRSGLRGPTACQQRSARSWACFSFDDPRLSQYGLGHRHQIGVQPLPAVHRRRHQEHPRIDSEEDGQTEEDGCDGEEAGDALGMGHVPERQKRVQGEAALPVFVK
jgi:hypothetical protein